MTKCVLLLTFTIFVFNVQATTSIQTLERTYNNMKIHAGMDDESTLEAGLVYAKSLVRAGRFGELKPLRREIISSAKRYQFDAIQTDVYKLNILITFREKLSVFLSAHPDVSYPLLSSFKKHQDGVTQILLEDLFYEHAPNILKVKGDNNVKLTELKPNEISKMLISEFKPSSILNYVIELLPRHVVLIDTYDNLLMAKVYFLKGLKHLSKGRKYEASGAFENASFLAEGEGSDVAIHILSEYYLNLLIANEIKEHKWPEYLNRYNLVNNQSDLHGLKL